ncbi:HAMP domain-containing protein, partial [Demequina iriomotensis]|uniref:HAMP domain-containing protein n=1 Tax=Demequina iriomotensis TaxID=1536641 RepID=UPI00146FE919
MDGLTAEPRKRGMKIRAQILMAFGIVVGLLWGSAIVASLELRDQGASGYNVAHDVAMLERELGDLRVALGEVQTETAVLTSAAGESEIAGAAESLDAAYAAFLASYESMFGAQPATAAEVSAAWEQYRDTLAGAAAAPDGASGGQAIALESRLQTVEAGVGDLATEVDEALEDLLLAHQVKSRDAVITVIALQVGATALALVLAFSLARRIGRGVLAVKGALDALAGGDLTVAATVRNRDEIGAMADALAVAQRALASTIAGVADSARTVAAAA